MATVIGKTSQRIDDLLADLVVSIEIIAGHLIITFRNGAVVDAGAIGGSSANTAAAISYEGSTNLSATNVEAALDELDGEKSPIGHTHDDRYYTEAEIAGFLLNKADSSHNHDDRYFTETEVTNLLSNRPKIYTALVPALAAGTLTTITHNLNNDTPGSVTIKEVATNEAHDIYWKVTGVNTIQVRSDVAFAANALKISVVA